nr:hypothetical protein [Vibrio alginolyticus]
MSASSSTFIAHNSTLEKYSALVTQPLLGQRLIKALESCAAISRTHNKRALQRNMLNLPKILVVDDNTVNQKIAGLHVTKAGFDFDVAVNGQEAVEKFSTESIQPNFNGLHDARNGWI